MTTQRTLRGALGVILTFAVIHTGAAGALVVALMGLARGQADVTAQQAAGTRGAGMPGAADLERARAAAQTQRREIFGPQNRALQPAGPNSFPKLDVPRQAGPDLQAVTTRYERQVAQHKTSGLMVFASLSMPPESLRRLLDQAARAGGVVVLRGFVDGSFKKTALALQHFGAAASGVQINPNAFHQYKVGAVPALVVTRADGGDQLDAEGCALPSQYVKLSGDVDLAYGLDVIAKEAPSFRQVALGFAAALAPAAR